jgi:hypothetical protein
MMPSKEPIPKRPRIERTSEATADPLVVCTIGLVITGWGEPIDGG